MKGRFFHAILQKIGSCPKGAGKIISIQSPNVRNQPKGPVSVFFLKNTEVFNNKLHMHASTTIFFCPET